MNEHIAARLAPEHRVAPCVERRALSRGFTTISPLEAAGGRTEPVKRWLPAYDEHRGLHWRPSWD